MTLSAIVLTKNEERNIKECLLSLKGLADEVVVMDSQSTDKTCEIAKAMGAKVISQEIFQGWGIKRQEAQKACSGEWILHLDADERLTDELKAELKERLATASGNEIFAIPRANHLFGERIAHCGWYPDFVRRCYRSDFTSFNDARVHEHVIIPEDGRVVELAHPMLHYTYQSVEQCLIKQKNYALAFSEEKAGKGKQVSLISIPLRGLFSFIRVYFIRKGFLDGRWGLWNAISTATYTMNKYLSLYAENHGRRLRAESAERRS